MLKRLLFWTAIICSLLHGGYYAKKSPARPPRPGPPRPPPRPPPPPLSPSSPLVSSSEAAVTEPTPTPRHSPSPPPIPVPLQPNQCSFGAENAYTTDFQGYLETDVLYVLANHPADCAGFVDSLEFCYFYNTTEAKNSSYTIHLLSFRPLYNTSGDVQLYRKINGASVDIDAFFNTSKGDGTLCQVIKPEDRLSLREGDVIGFATEQGFNIALMASDEKGVFQYVPSDSMQQELSVHVLQLEFIPTAQLKQANNTATPVLKIVMNITETSSQILPTPIPTATTSPDPDMCNGDKNNHEKTVSMLVFVSVLTASAVVILALTVVVIILSCKICYNKKCLSCHRKRQGAQKVSGITDQSMQYNELYLPADPAKVIVRGGLMRSTKLHENPAYDLHTTSDRRELDHTYESIKFSHVSQS